MTAWLLMAGGLLCPVAAFALLLWLTHLEDTLPRDVRSHTRRPDPPPILAIRVREAVSATPSAPTPSAPTPSAPLPSAPLPSAPVDVPRQRSAPVVEGSAAAAR